ncbi:MAG: tetratricopeptide repeat protein [Oleiphilaceae bacterium]|nr:tetratricopeptide repeat protein [Oleiphilaceae bacterium]
MHYKGWAGLLLALLLAGCSAIEPMQPPEERPSGEVSPEETAPESASETRPVPPERAPQERRSGDALSPAAASLLATARGFLQGGDPDRALTLIHRAHGISPNAAEVYYHFARAYLARREYQRAEQFAGRGLALAGDRDSLHRQGEQLLAEIRQAGASRTGSR